MQPALVASSSVSTVLETTTQVQNELIETTDIEPLNAQIKRKRSISYNTLPTCENTISLCDSYLQYIKVIILFNYHVNFKFDNFFIEFIFSSILKDIFLII